MSLRNQSVLGLLGALLIASSGCGSKSAPVQPATRSGEGDEIVVQVPNKPDKPANARPALEIGSLRGRTHTLTIYSAEDGPRYTVSTNDGQVLGERLSVDELRAQLPDVFEHFKSAVAGSGSHLDASARVPSRDMRPPITFQDASLDAALSSSR